MKIKACSIIFWFFNVIIAQESSMLTSIPTISWQELSDLMIHDAENFNKNYWIINVLPRDIYADCHIPGSINIPTHVLGKKIKKWPRDRNIILYCAGGNCPLSRYAYQSVKSLGFINVKVLEGGLRNWNNNMMQLNGYCKSGYLLG